MSEKLDVHPSPFDQPIIFLRPPPNYPVKVNGYMIKKYRNKLYHVKANDTSICQAHFAPSLAWKSFFEPFCLNQQDLKKVFLKIPCIHYLKRSGMVSLLMAMWHFAIFLRRTLFSKSRIIAQNICSICCWPNKEERKCGAKGNRRPWYFALL